MLPHLFLWSLHLTILGYCTNLSIARSIPREGRCVTAVCTALNYVSFSAVPNTGYWDTICHNPLKVTSIYAASETYCRGNDLAFGLCELEKACRDSGHNLLPRKALGENLTHEALQRMRKVDYLEVPRMEFLNEPVLVSQSYFDRVFRTIVSDSR